MDFSRNIKIVGIVLAGIAMAFLSGYILFSYFSTDKDENVQLSDTQTTPVETDAEDSSGIEQNDSEGILPSNGSVAGASDSNGISSVSGNFPNTNKGGVLGETTINEHNPSYEGIQPTNESVDRNTITEEDRQEYRDAKKKDKYEDVDTSHSEVYIYEYPEIDEEDDYTQYTYTFEFNDDAQIRYRDGFKYSFDEESCNDDDYFTSDSYDFSGKIDNVDEYVEIKVRIDNDYLDEKDDFDDSEYKLEGEKYVVRGDIKVPHCTD